MSRASNAYMGYMHAKDTENTIGQFESPKNSEKHRERYDSGKIEML